MKTNSNVGLLILGGAGLLYFMNATKAKAAPARVTTGTARPPVDSFDKLFASRAQQPTYNGSGGGVQAAVDLTGAGKAIWDALRKAASGLGGTFKAGTSPGNPNPVGNDTQVGDAPWYAKNYPSDPSLDNRFDPELAAMGEFDNYGTIYDESSSSASIDYGSSNEFDASFESSTGF